MGPLYRNFWVFLQVVRKVKEELHFYCFLVVDIEMGHWSFPILCPFTHSPAVGSSWLSIVSLFGFPSSSAEQSFLPNVMFCIHRQMHLITGQCRNIKAHPPWLKARQIRRAHLSSRAPCGIQLNSIIVRPLLPNSSHISQSCDPENTTPQTVYNQICTWEFVSSVNWPKTLLSNSSQRKKDVMFDMMPECTRRKKRTWLSPFPSLLGLCKEMHAPPATSFCRGSTPGSCFSWCFSEAHLSKHQSHFTIIGL